MSCQAVIGLGFGDEGKGLATDYLCSQKPDSLVVRFSGGHQAGHNVVVENTSHIFASFGSGTLRGCPTYWSKNCTVSPTMLLNELSILKTKNIEPVLYIDDKCPITTPYDIFYNKENNKHGTCGVGFGATIEREENHYSLLFEDLFNEKILIIKLNMISEYYDTIEDCKNFIEDCNVIIKSHNILRSNILSMRRRNIIFEGSQGLLLDKNIGFFPHVTRSNTGLKNIDVNSYNLRMGDSPDVYYITRAYQTRHGKGPTTNEEITHNIKIDKNETNVENEYQGKFRRSILDLDLLLYGLNKDRSPLLHNILVITCLDHINEYKYTYKGNLIEENNESQFIKNISNILDFNDVYISRSNESKNIERYR